MWQLDHDEAGLELLAAVAVEGRPGFGAGDDGGEVAHHLAAVADAQGEGVLALEEGGKLVLEAGVEQDGFGPALARADIGFAMGAAGADTAIETADVALMDDDLRKIPQFIRLSQATSRILKQNIALALGIKAVFLVLTFTGDATMWMAVFADMGASLLVVGNGLRLLKK